MEKQKIEEMFSKAVAAKLARSKANGTIAQWTMSDHLDVATRVVMVEVGIDEGDAEVFASLREVVQATYNHSAFAQRLDKMFDVKDNTAGHFRRERKEVKVAKTYGLDVAALLAEPKAAE